MKKKVTRRVFKLQVRQAEVWAFCTSSDSFRNTILFYFDTCFHAARYLDKQSCGHSAPPVVLSVSPDDRRMGRRRCGTPCLSPTSPPPLSSVVGILSDNTCAGCIVLENNKKLCTMCSLSLTTTTTLPPLPNSNWVPQSHDILPSLWLNSFNRIKMPGRKSVQC